MAIKRKKILLLTAIVAVGLSYYFYAFQHRTKLTHYETALAHFEQQKKNLINYYCSDDYLRDVTAVCTQAATYFETVPVQKNSLVIFDIDDTALIHFQTRDQLNFVWTKIPHLLQAQRDDFDPALEPVLKLYKKLIAQGFKIVFMTGRRNDIKEKTIKNLKDVGYHTYEQLMLFPEDLLNKMSIGEWKAEQRRKLAQTYEIVGNIGDRPVDFEQGNNGYAVKLPNYLY